MHLLTIIKAVGRLAAPPPPVEERERFREWFGRTTDVLTELASYTFTELDSRTAAVALALVTDDEYWKTFHDALVVALGYCSVEDRGAACTHCVAVAQIAVDMDLRLEDIQVCMQEITEVVHYFRVYEC